jgi:hypothetical protein
MIWIMVRLATNVLKGDGDAQTPSYHANEDNDPRWDGAATLLHYVTHHHNDIGKDHHHRNGKKAGYSFEIVYRMIPAAYQYANSPGKKRGHLASKPEQFAKGIVFNPIGHKYDVNDNQNDHQNYHYDPDRNTHK